MTPLTDLPIWPEITAHAQSLKTLHLRQMFDADKTRFERFSLKADELFLDYSKQRINAQTLGLLEKLLDHQGFVQERARLFAGEKVNASEGRAALHMNLRSKSNPEIVNERNRALSFAQDVRAGLIKGATGKIIKNIIHVGIGGSDLGPQLLVTALGDDKAPDICFVRNVDAPPLVRIMRNINPEETLLLIASKTFTTVETMLNAQTLIDWFSAAMDKTKAMQHVVALTAAPEKAVAFGIDEKHIFRFWDFVGGRFSIWSVIGLPAMMALGRERFEAFLAGGAAMDMHFQDAPLLQNMPVIMALLSIWNINFLGCHARAVLPYCEALREWPSYLQQLEMESLGKNIDRDGKTIPYSTAPVVFGMTGTPAQHAFMQALHQGTQIIPSEILLVKKDETGLTKHHAMLLANGLAQAEALALGKDSTDTQKYFAGNRPSSLIVLDRLSPFVLGQLVALYEHKVFTEGVLWNINPFDQWGVELGKVLAKPIESALVTDGAIYDVTSSTAGLIRHLRNL